MNHDWAAVTELDTRIRESVRGYEADAWRADVAEFVREFRVDGDSAVLAAEASIGALHRLAALGWDHERGAVVTLADAICESVRPAWEGTPEEIRPWQLLFGAWLRLPGEVFEHAASVYDDLRESGVVRGDGSSAKDSLGPRSPSRSKSSSRKQYGSFYTPDSIIEATLNRVFTANTQLSNVGIATPGLPGRCLEKNPVEDVGEARGGQDSASALVVLDPAMGCGFFLLAALRRLVLVRLAAKPAFVGALCTEGELSDSSRPDSALAEVIRDWTPAMRDALTDSIRNSLRFAELDPRCVTVFEATLRLIQRAFDVPKEQLVRADGVIGDALASNVSEAGYVIGNPPWQSYSGRQSFRAGAELVALIDRHPEASGWPSSHSLFILEAIRHWLTDNEGATLGFVLPAAFAHLDSYAPVRAAVRATCHVDEPLHAIEESAFRGVVQESLVLIARRRRTLCSMAEESPFTVQRDPIDEQRTASATDRLQGETFTKDVLLEALASCPKVAAEMFGDVGVHTGNCASKLIKRKQGPGDVPILEGRDISAFVCGEPRRWLDVSYAPADGEYFRIASPERFAAAGVIIRQTASDIVACANPLGLRFRNSALGCFPPDGVDVGWVLAWLNHDLVTMFHRSTVYESGQKSFPQVKIRHLRNLPCPDWESLRELQIPADRESQDEVVRRHLLRGAIATC